MVLTSAVVEPLRKYLQDALPKVCDAADPSALANYIIALLERDQPQDELKASCVEKLNEFLEKETKPFVEKLFAFMASQQSAPSAMKETSSKDVVFPVSSRDRGSRTSEADDEFEDDDDDSFKRRRRDRGREHDPAAATGVEHPARKRPRSADDDGDSAKRGRFHSPELAHQEALTAAPSSMDAIPRGGMQRRGQPFGGRRRGRCRDFFENGRCYRGDQCPYSHGDDFRVEQSGEPVYDPERAAFDKPPSSDAQRWPAPPRLPVPVAPVGFPAHPPARGRDTGRRGFRDASDSIVLTHGTQRPSGPAPPPSLEPSAGPVDVTAPPPAPRLPPPSAGPVTSETRLQRVPVARDVPSVQPDDKPADARFGRRPARSTFREAQHETAPNSTRLFVTGIPRELLNMPALHSHFSKFGTVVNIRISETKNNAVIAFRAHAEAEAALNSSDAVCGNRFIKVFWAKYDQQAPPALSSSAAPEVTRVQASSGRVLSVVKKAKGSQPAAPLPSARDVAAMIKSGQLTPASAPASAARPTSNSAKPSSQPTSSSSAPKPASVPTAEIAQMKQALLQKLIQQQKTLIAKMDKGKGEMTAEQKQELSARIAELNQAIESALQNKGQTKNPSATPQHKTAEEAEHEQGDLE